MTGCVEMKEKVPWKERYGQIHSMLWKEGYNKEERRWIAKNLWLQCKFEGMR